MSDISVAIVEDDSRYRHSLELLFRNAPCYILGASFSTARGILEALDRRSAGEKVVWHIVLMDLHLPGMSGIEAIREIKHRVPDLPIVALTVFEDPGTILQAIVAGADGYLLKRSSVAELLTELRGVTEGAAPLTGGVARTILDLLRTPKVYRGGPPSRLALTDRELDVLRALVAGKSYASAAKSLCISLDTVRTHIRSIYGKLRVQRASEAVAKAIRDGLV